MISANIWLVYSIEQDNRHQSREFNLDNIKKCMDRTGKTKYNLELDYRAEICIESSRTTYTGNVYVLDYETLEVKYDSSRDIPQDTIMYFTEESIGQHFYDWKSGADAINYMTRGGDSIAHMDIWYNYDGVIEWVEWITYEDIVDCKLYIIVQGSQKDEAIAQYNGIYYYTMVYILLLSIGIMTSAFSRSKNDRFNCSGCQ